MKYPWFKEFLSRLGIFVPPKFIHYASGVLNYLAVGRWLKDRNLQVPVRCGTREDLYDYLFTFVKEPVTYLEFGVFQGLSLGHWIKLLKNRDSRFHGFDSFEGLPEIWKPMCDKKTFDVQGRIPDFNDPRVHLHKGWFNETVPVFAETFQSLPQLIVHIDCDLYSSTILCLKQLKPFLKSGAILIFDEFFDREHEMKAFTEFLQEDQARVECLCGTRALTQIAFRITAPPIVG